MALGATGKSLEELHEEGNDGGALACGSRSRFPAGQASERVDEQWVGERLYAADEIRPALVGRQPGEGAARRPEVRLEARRAPGGRSGGPRTTAKQRVNWITAASAAGRRRVPGRQVLPSGASSRLERQIRPVARAPLPIRRASIHRRQAPGPQQHGATESRTRPPARASTGGSTDVGCQRAGQAPRHRGRGVLQASSGR
jgi:hypothetical protein